MVFDHIYIEESEACVSYKFSNLSELILKLQEIEKEHGNKFIPSHGVSGCGEAWNEKSSYVIVNPKDGDVFLDSDPIGKVVE